MERVNHHRKKRGFCFLGFPFAIAFGFFLVASTMARAQTDPMSQPEVQRGKAQFQQSCAMCHGANATGGIGPNLLQSSVLRQSKYHNLIEKVIQEGRPDRGMPAFPQLSATNISDIVAFLHAQLEIAKTSDSAEFEEEQSLKELLTGNAGAGETYFNGPGKCATCHSVTGDMAHIAGKYSPAALQTAFIYPRHQNVTATVSLSSGKKMTGKLVHFDAFYVAIMDEGGWYHSWPVQNVKVEINNPLAGHLSLLDKYTDKDIHDVFAYLETLK